MDEPSIARSEMRTARKQHRCYECGNFIIPGSRYEHVKGCWDGKWAEFKTCDECQDLRDQVLEQLTAHEEGPAFGEVREWAREMGIAPRGA